MHKPWFSYTLGDTAYSQEHLKTMVYAKFGGGGTKCIVGNVKIEKKVSFSKFSFRRSSAFSVPF